MGRGQVKKIPSPPIHCASIKDYERSPFWRYKSSELLDNKECICHICKRRRWKWLTRKQQWKRVLRFGVHHRTYARCPHEAPEDLITVCSLCHIFCHDALRYRNISSLYGRVAEIVEEYFDYEGASTFIPW